MTPDDEIYATSSQPETPVIRAGGLRISDASGYWSRRNNKSGVFNGRNRPAETARATTAYAGSKGAM